MRSARVVQAAHLAEMPDQDAGAEPVIRVLTDGAAGTPNAFYIDPKDRLGTPIDPLPGLNDEVVFDMAGGAFRKTVVWNGRSIRQRGYSFDWHDKGRQN